MEPEFGTESLYLYNFMCTVWETDFFSISALFDMIQESNDPKAVIENGGLMPLGGSEMTG